MKHTHKLKYTHKLKHKYKLKYTHKSHTHKPLVGGSINSNYIKLLSQFPLDDFGIYLNPIYGLMASKSLVPSFFNLGHNVADDNNSFYNTLHTLFKANSIAIEPSKSDCLRTILPQHIGYIIGQLYIQNIKKHTSTSNKVTIKKILYINLKTHNQLHHLPTINQLNLPLLTTLMPPHQLLPPQTMLLYLVILKMLCHI